MSGMNLTGLIFLKKKVHGKLKGEIRKNTEKENKDKGK